MTNSEAIERLNEMYLDGCYVEESLDAVESEEAIHVAISCIKENDKLKAEIERIKEDYSVLARQYNNVENSSIRYYNEVKQLKAELEKLDKYNSELCMELTITMDKLCLAEKEIEWLEKER